MLSMTTLRGLRALTAPAIAAFAFSACSDDDGVTRAAVETNTDNTVYGLAAQTSVTSTLTSAIDAAGLASVLQGDGPSFLEIRPVESSHQGGIQPNAGEGLAIPCQLIHPIAFESDADEIAAHQSSGAGKLPAMNLDAPVYLSIGARHRHGSRRLVDHRRARHITRGVELPTQGIFR